MYVSVEAHRLLSKVCDMNFNGIKYIQITIKKITIKIKL